MFRQHLDTAYILWEVHPIVSACGDQVPLPGATKYFVCSVVCTESENSGRRVAVVKGGIETVGCVSACTQPERLRRYAKERLQCIHQLGTGQRLDLWPHQNEPFSLPRLS